MRDSSPHHTQGLTERNKKFPRHIIHEEAFFEPAFVSDTPEFEPPLEDNNYFENISFEGFAHQYDNAQAYEEPLQNACFEEDFFSPKDIPVQDNFSQDNNKKLYNKERNLQNLVFIQTKTDIKQKEIPKEISKEILQETPVDWQAFLSYCEEKEFEEEYMPYLRHSSANLLSYKDTENQECVIRMPSDVEFNQISSVRFLLEKNLRDFLNNDCAITYNTSVHKRRTRTQMMEEMQEHPQIIMLQKEFGASLLTCNDLRKR